MLSPHKRRRNLWPDADQPPRFGINHRPGCIRPHDHLALGINKIDPPVKLRTLGFALNPTAGRDAFTRRNIAAIVNLVPRHDPMISRDMFRRGNRLPMRRRHVLNPPHPDGIVDMAKRVDVRGGCGQGSGEGGQCRPSISLRAASVRKALRVNLREAAAASMASKTPRSIEMLIRCGRLLT